MLKVVRGCEKDLKPPSYHEVRVSYLKKTTEKYERWEKWGCTLMCNGWTDGKGRSLTNSSGTIFFLIY